MSGILVAQEDIMAHSNFSPIEKRIKQLHNKSNFSTTVLFPGIELSFIHLETDKIDFHHDALDHMLEINYCHSGRIGWQLTNGNFVYLGPGDYALHTMKTCAESVMTLPNGDYDGLTICIDLDKLSKNPPELLADTNINGTFLYDKFCKNEMFSSFSGNSETENIFRNFYGKQKQLQHSYYQIKTLELLLYLCELDFSGKNQLSEYQSEQIELIRTIHEQLISNLDKRFTIDALSKQYLINTTTLKTMFKAVYGTSIASHVKAHRMEKAAGLLRNTQESIADIAIQVGYDSQSKFSASFREQYHMLPSEYRKTSLTE